MEGALEIQQQLINLQQELTRAKEEHSQALQDVEKMKKTMASYAKGKQTRAFIEFLQNEAQKAKQSETKMLESLVSQTKQLEQTKISFEESKLEIESLHEFIKMLSLEKKHSDEVHNLKNELKLALQAEEQSKKAMDALALALIEVSNDSKETKAKLRSTEEKLREAVAESQRLKRETEELFASCHEKETGFINRVKASEDEMSEIREENKRLMEMNRASREEISKLRDILKQAVNEATAVKEALEIVKAENFQMKDLMQEKEDNLNRLKQEFESLKVSEAAATDSVKELKALIAATSSMERPVVVRIRRQNSWGEMEGDESPWMNSGKEGKGVGFEWSNKQKKKKQFLRSFSDILRRKSCQSKMIT